MLDAKKKKKRCKIMYKLDNLARCVKLTTGAWGETTTNHRKIKYGRSVIDPR